MARQTDKPQYLLRQTHFWKSSGKKVFQNAGILHIFKCASRHSRVSFFNIGSSKSGPYPSVFSHFDLQRRFAPQWRARSEAPKSVPQWGLTNALGATMACHFSKSDLQKWLLAWGVWCILTCTCASRHSGVPFFRPENTGIRDFPNMWRVCIFFLLTLLARWSSFYWLDFATVLFNCLTWLLHSAFQLSILNCGKLDF